MLPTKYPASSKYFDIHINVQFTSENYDQISALVKSNDKTFKIQSLSGDKYFLLIKEKILMKSIYLVWRKKKKIINDFLKILINASTN